jgi:hypothetical protein
MDPASDPLGNIESGMPIGRQLDRLMLRKSNRKARRLLIVVVAGAWVIAILAAVVTLLKQGVEDASEWAGVLGSLTALAVFSASLVASIISRIKQRAHVSDGFQGTPVHARAADDLARAVQAQWQEEAKLHRLQDPWPLPVRWVAADADIQEHWNLIFPDAPNDTLSRQRLAGELSEAREIYGKLPHGRIVVIGPPGSGKSIFAIVLVLQIIGHRQSGDAVPVIFPAGTWDPSEVGLSEWLIGYLVENYHLGGRLERDNRAIARTLVFSGKILPFVDGIDEMPPQLRPLAIERLNRSLGAEQSVVVTCRADEYHQVVDSADGLTFAAVLELEPLSNRTIIQYLNDTTPGGRRGRRWEHVFARLVEEPNGTLAQVLSSPLMISLVRTVYGDSPRDPQELLDQKFRDRLALEDHLLDQLIPAAYYDSLQTGTSRVWSAEDVTPWLTFLARQMADSDRTDLAWWRLERSVPWVVSELLNAGLCGIALAVALDPFIGCCFVLLVISIRACLKSRPNSLEELLRGRLNRFHFLPLVGFITGLSGRMTLERRIGVSIGRLAGFSVGAYQVLYLHEAGTDLYIAVARGVSAGLAVGLAVSFFAVSLRYAPSEVQFDSQRGLRMFAQHLLKSLVIGSGIGVAASVLVNSTFGILVGLTIWITLGLIDGLNLWLDVSTDTMTALSPRSTCRADRFAALSRGAAVGVAISSVVFAAFTLAYGWTAAIAPALGWGVVFAISDRLEGVGATVWGRYLVAKMLLALRNRLPWRFMTFLDDAHAHEVLRRAGAVYQFRHARLQTHLSQVQA